MAGSLFDFQGPDGRLSEPNLQTCQLNERGSSFINCNYFEFEKPCYSIGCLLGTGTLPSLLIVHSEWPSTGGLSSWRHGAVMEQKTVICPFCPFFINSAMEKDDPLLAISKPVQGTSHTEFGETGASDNDKLNAGPWFKCHSGPPRRQFQP